MWSSMSRCYLMRDRSMESGRAGQGTEREVEREEEEEERRERRRGEWRLSRRELVARLKPSPGKEGWERKPQ